jgi:hypothetical protein
MKAISTKSWNGVEFYFDRWHGKFVQHDMADLSSINFHCDETDLESAKEIAIQEELTCHAVLLFEIDNNILYQ